MNSAGCGEIVSLGMTAILNTRDLTGRKTTDFQITGRV